MTLEVRRFEPQELEALQRDLPSWSSAEYPSRLEAQARGEMVQVFAWDGPLPQCADITGVYGVSFLIVWVNAALFLLLRDMRHRNIPWKVLAVTAFLLVSDCLYGRIRIKEVDMRVVQSPSLRVGLVQGNIDQGIKWDKRFREQALAIHQSLSLRALKDNAGLIIWPDSATPFYLQDEPHYQEALFGLIQGSNAFLLVGSPCFAQDHRGVSHFNSAFLLSPAGTIAGRYDKMHLVPYGEYVPLKKFFFFIDKGYSTVQRRSVRQTANTHYLRATSGLSTPTIFTQGS